MMMKFADWLKAECNEKLPDDYVDGLWLMERGLPLVVVCSRCKGVVILPSAYIDEKNRCYCHLCAGVEVED